MNEAHDAKLWRTIVLITDYRWHSRNQDNPKLERAATAFQDALHYGYTLTYAAEQALSILENTNEK